MKPHKFVLLICISLCLWFAGCRALCRVFGAAGGAVAASPAGPLGIAGGAALGDTGGDKLADALGADREYTAKQYRAMLGDARNELNDAHKAIAELQGRAPVEVYVPEPFIPRWAVWLAIALVMWILFRFRHGIIAFVGSIATGGFWPATVTAVGMAVGGNVADIAKETVAIHAQAVGDKRRAKLARTPPVFVNPVTTKGPHSE